MSGKNHDKLIRILQIAAGLFMCAMILLSFYLMDKYNISITNIQQTAEQIKGDWIVIALGIIIFSIVKTFSLVFPPGIIFAVCGYLMPNLWLGIAVNTVALLISFPLGFYLGRFTGAGIISSLEKRFKSIKKIEDFTDSNEVLMTFAIKLSGIIPNDMSSLIFGAMKISFSKFMTGSFLGSVPLIVAYSVLGFVLNHAKEKVWLIVLVVALLVAYAVVATIITKKVVSKNKQNKNKIQK